MTAAFQPAAVAAETHGRPMAAPTGYSNKKTSPQNESIPGNCIVIVGRNIDGYAFLLFLAFTRKRSILRSKSLKRQDRFYRQACGRRNSGAVSRPHNTPIGPVLPFLDRCFLIGIPRTIDLFCVQPARGDSCCCFPEKTVKKPEKTLIFSLTSISLCGKVSFGN